MRMKTNKKPLDEGLLKQGGMKSSTLEYYHIL